MMCPNWGFMPHASGKTGTSSAECTACKFLIGLAQQYVTSNSSITKIEAEVQKLCKDLPNTNPE